MSKLKVAIVGCGGIANQKHMPSLKTQEEWVQKKSALRLLMIVTEKG